MYAVPVVLAVKQQCVVAVINEWLSVCNNYVAAMTITTTSQLIIIAH